MSGLSVKEAKRLEDSFLGGITEAQDAYEQIVANEAWTVLGYDTFSEWWTERVHPLMRQLSMFPNRALAAKVIEQVRADEAELPAAQRRTQAELGELVGQDRRTVSGWKPPVQDQPQVQDVPRADLGQPAAEPVDPLPAAAKEWIGNRIAERVTRPVSPPIQPADPGVRERLAREREEQGSREAFSKSLARCVWLLAQYGSEVDAADKHVKDWQPSQDVYPLPTTAVRLRAAGDYLYALAERWPQ